MTFRGEELTSSILDGPIIGFTCGLNENGLPVTLLFSTISYLCGELAAEINPTLGPERNEGGMPAGVPARILKEDAKRERLNEEVHTLRQWS
jgi:hypothetical protein